MSFKDQLLPSLEERLQKLDEIDSKVMQIMESSGGTLEELSKDVPNQKQIEIHTRNFRAAIRDVELELITQLNYLGQVLTGLPFEKNVYKETMDLSLASECLKDVQKSLETDTTPDNLLEKDFSCAISPLSEATESDTVVSSTVNEFELRFAEASDVSNESADPAPFKHYWRVVPFMKTYSSHSTEGATPDVSTHEFEIPEYEFDDEVLSLQGDIDADPLWDIDVDDVYADGRITPEGLIDEDFERELVSVVVRLEFNQGNDVAVHVHVCHFRSHGFDTRYVATDIQEWHQGTFLVKDSNSGNRIVTSDMSDLPRLDSYHVFHHLQTDTPPFFDGRQVFVDSENFPQFNSKYVWYDTLVLAKYATASIDSDLIKLSRKRTEVHFIDSKCTSIYMDETRRVTDYWRSYHRWNLRQASWAMRVSVRLINNKDNAVWLFQLALKIKISTYLLKNIIP
ncbi:hypothetical protein ACTXT7_015695 [Hymenolepis weldensis]